MIWLAFPELATAVLSSLGVIFLSILIFKFLLILEWRLLKTNRPSTPTQYKLFLLEEENKKLNHKITELELENSNIINSLIKHLQG
jgi:hypothetical protein